MKTIDFIYAGITCFALFIGIAAFIAMVRSSSGFEFENDPIDVPGENSNWLKFKMVITMYYDDEYNYETNLNSEEPWYLLFIEAIIVLLLYCGICIIEKIVSLWRSL